MAENNSSAISNLNREWKVFQDRRGYSQVEASQKLGWSDSFFGSLLRGTHPLSLDNLIKIADFLDISPTKIDPSYERPRVDFYEITGTTSGKPPPAPVRYFHPGRLQFWCDKPVPIFNDSRLIQGHRAVQWSAGTTLFCIDEDVPLRVDDNFLANNIPYWLVFRPGKDTVSINNTKKPNFFKGEVHRIVGIHLL